MIIVVVNNKGGTAKTTTCVNLAAALASREHRVLLVDLDSQASASLSLGVLWRDLSPSVCDVLFAGTPLNRVVRASRIPGVDLVTAEMELANSDCTLSGTPGWESLLKDALDSVRHRYDYILCDCPPSLSMIPVSAMVAADAFLVPVAPEYLALEGLVSLMDVVEKLRANMGVGARLLGIVFTLVEPSWETGREVVRLVRDRYGKSVFSVEIPRNVKVSDAPAYDLSVVEYAPDSPGARAYVELAKEVVERCAPCRKKRGWLRRWMGR